MGPCTVVEVAEAATPRKGSCDGKADGWLYLQVRQAD